MSDMISRAIIQLLDEHEGTAQIQRNELASRIGCVPSQINYVITSRFTPEQGFIVESKRGGGGYIRIRRMAQPHDGSGTAAAIMHLVNNLGDSVSEHTVRVILQNLLYQGIVSQQVAKLMTAALSDHALRPVDQEQRDMLRARLFKQMLVSL